MRSKCSAWAYDTKSNFRYLDGKGIEPAIKVRKNSSSKAGGCMPRKLAAQEYLRDMEAWKRMHGYGQRWMVKSAFSSLMMRNITNEIMLKASLYTVFIGPTTRTRNETDRSPRKRPRQEPVTQHSTSVASRCSELDIVAFTAADDCTVNEDWLSCSETSSTTMISWGTPERVVRICGYRDAPTINIRFR